MDRIYRMCSNSSFELTNYQVTCFFGLLARKQTSHGFLVLSPDSLVFHEELEVLIIASMEAVPICPIQLCNRFIMLPGKSSFRAV